MLNHNHKHRSAFIANAFSVLFIVSAGAVLWKNSSVITQQVASPAHKIQATSCCAVRAANPTPPY